MEVENIKTVIKTIGLMGMPFLVMNLMISMFVIKSENKLQDKSENTSQNKSDIKLRLTIFGIIISIALLIWSELI